MNKFFLSVVVLAALSGCEGDKKVDTEDTEDTIIGTDGDEDQDGFTIDDNDCNDNDANVNPAATETCNGNDDNCDGVIDEGVTETYYLDLDGDGFGDPETSREACELPSGYVQNGTDCDDAEPNAFPGNNEVCDNIDNDCDGTVDNGVTDTYYSDADGDGYGDLTAALEACDQPVGYVTDSSDCDDTTNRSFPGNGEVCDEIDNNCDGTVDEGVTTTYYADFDSDGYGNAALTQEACSVPTGYTTNADDCDDSTATTNPGATEYCNGADDDCDGTIDEDTSADAPTWYADTDGDAYGNASTSIVACTQPAGYVADSTDCDDGRALTNPAATEYCNGFDDDCDGATDEDSAVDAITWYLDGDSDTYGDSSITDVSCTQPARYVAANGDCDDADSSSYPGGIEVCDGADNDCDGAIDEDGEVTDGTDYYYDADGDGTGDPSITIAACTAPAGYVNNDYDCDDTDGTEPIVVDAVNGTSGGTGTLALPLDRLQDGIDRSSLCVIALPGTYTEQIDLSGKSIDVWGIDGEDYTTIDANMPACDSTSPTGCGPTVTVASGSNAAPTIHGFTITGGSGETTSASSTTTCADSSASHTGRTDCTVTVYEYCGGGIYVDGDDPAFYDIIVRDNALPAFEQASVASFEQYWLYSYGGGACLRNSNATFATSTFVENYADQGGGIYVTDGSSVTFESGYVSENDASDGAGVNLDGADVNFTNAVLHCNDAVTDGGGLFTETSGTATFTNSVFYGNDSSSSGTQRGADAYVGTSTTFNMTNSIVEANHAVYALYGAGSGTLDYNNVYNSAGGTYGGTLTAGANSISSGSNFNRSTCDNNPDNDDFTLRSASASVDAGDPASSPDVDGTPNDQGAYGGPGGTW